MKMPNEKLQKMLDCLNLSEEEINQNFANCPSGSHFLTLCNLKEAKLAGNRPTLEDFLSTSKSVGVARACNQHFYSGMTENEVVSFNRLFYQSEVTAKDIYDSLSKVLKNPLQLVG